MMLLEMEALGILITKWCVFLIFQKLFFDKKKNKKETK